MENFLAQALQNDEELREIFRDDPEATDWFYASSSVGIGPNVANPDTPWMAWNELPSMAYQEVSETSNSQLRTFQFFVYDEKGDFTRINEALRVIRRIVKNIAPFTTPEGHRCSGSQWMGFSGNLPADAYDGVCRFGTARFTVSE